MALASQPALKIKVTAPPEADDSFPGTAHSPARHPEYSLLT